MTVVDQAVVAMEQHLLEVEGRGWAVFNPHNITPR